MQQRSKEWFEARRGRFTASEIHRILGKQGLKGTNGAIDLMGFEKAVESCFGIDETESFLSADMQRGVNLEPVAFELFKEKKELEFLDVEECGFFKIGGNAGASPDGLIKTNGAVTSVLEIKCPKHLKFFKLVANGESEIDFKYIAQMNMQMLSTNTEKCSFFNYLLFNNEEYSHEIIVKKNNTLCDLIESRVKEVSKVRDEYIKKLTNNVSE